MSENLESHLSGRWVRGEGIEARLVDPVRGDELATVSAKGLDLAEALAFARKRGQGGLRELGYAGRAKLLGAVADVLAANRARYEEIAIANSGNTKIDAAIDIDGGIGTLKYYSRLGSRLGEGRMLLDEKPVRLAKAENYQAIHLMVPRRGVAVHINAFNFPSWGLWEKAAVSLLAACRCWRSPHHRPHCWRMRWCATCSLPRCCRKARSASSAAAPGRCSTPSPATTSSPSPAPPTPLRACAATPTWLPAACRSTSRPTASMRRCSRPMPRPAAPPSMPSCARSPAR
jgi:hypothetical protein